jgi:hypothetical protein
MKATRSAAPATTLHQLQSWLFEQVTREAPEAASSSGARELAQRVVSGGGLSAAARVEVYRHGYFARLVECLVDDYPALAHALGAQRFEDMCRDFIVLHPPASASLNDYGAPFAAYCGQLPQSWSAFARDLAQLEWAVVEAIHAEEGERLDVEALGRLSAEQWSTARLVPSPALRLLFSAYPAEEYYRAFKAGSAAEFATERSGGELGLPAPAACAVVVCRRGEDVWRLRLSVPLGRLLERLITGVPLLEALERFGTGARAADHAAANDAAADHAAADHAAIAPEDLQLAFRDWVSCGLFAGVALD